MVVLVVFCAGCHTAGRGTKGEAGKPPSTVPGTGTGPPTSELLKAFDSVRKRYAGDIVGICMGAIDRGTRAIRCYGKARPGGAAPPTPTTLFQIGSLTKTFTATLLALRTTQGKVALADPAQRYFPTGRIPLPDSLTLRDLADHYSGLPRSTPLNTISVPSADAYLRQAAPCMASSNCRVSLPGKRYAYSNYGYGVLGELLGRHDGYTDGATSAWEQDNRANVTGPLGMRDTHSWSAWRAMSSPEFDTRRALPVRRVTPPYFPPAPYADASAGLYSTGADMETWLSYSMGMSGTSALNAGRPYLYDMQALLRPRQDQSNKRRLIGLAWRVDTYGAGSQKVECVYKDGLARGFTASMIFIKGRDVGAFVMLNTEPNTPAIAAALVNALPDAKKIAPRACGSGGG